MSVLDVKSDAARAYKVLRAGGIAILPNDVGYSLIGGSAAALKKIFDTKLAHMAWLYADKSGPNGQDRGRAFIDLAYPRFFKRELDYEDRAAIDALRRQGASRVILAVPVGPPSSVYGHSPESST